MWLQVLGRNSTLSHLFSGLTSFGLSLQDFIFWLSIILVALLDINSVNFLIRHSNHDNTWMLQNKLKLFCYRWHRNDFIGDSIWLRMAVFYSHIIFPSCVQFVNYNSLGLLIHNLMYMWQPFFKYFVYMPKIDGQLNNLMQQKWNFAYMKDDPNFYVCENHWWYWKRREIRFSFLSPDHIPGKQ